MDITGSINVAAAHQVVLVPENGRRRTARHHRFFGPKFLENMVPPARTPKNLMREIVASKKRAKVRMASVQCGNAEHAIAAEEAFGDGVN